MPSPMPEVLFRNVEKLRRYLSLRQFARQAFPHFSHIAVHDLKLACDQPHNSVMPTATMMRFTIQRKVFLATFALSCVLVSVLALVVRWNMGQGFERYVSAAEFARLDWLVRKVESEYASHGNWFFLRDSSGQTWRGLLRPPPGRWMVPLASTDSVQRGAPRDPVPADTLRIGPRIGLRDAQGQPLAGAEIRVTGTNLGASFAQRPILYQGAVVGHLTLQAAPAALDALDVTFLTSQNRNLLLAAVAAVMLSAMAAWLLSRHLLRPIAALHKGANQIAQGQLDARIPVHSHDEMGDLAQTFNTMAKRLGSMEASRRSWIADTSHELRTPLAVLRAEIEALQDGVHSPDRSTLDRMHRQTTQLTQLVDDLRLSSELQDETKCSDRELIAPIEVLGDSVAGFQQRFTSVNMTVDISGVASPEPALWLMGNAGRLRQVFDNLLENSLRYTHSGGRLTITTQATSCVLIIHFDDTAPAPPSEALPHLFERFFRVDASRSRATGGSGLGLAICKVLVEWHGGSLEAKLSKFGGLRVTVSLPVCSAATETP